MGVYSASYVPASIQPSLTALPGLGQQNTTALNSSLATAGATGLQPGQSLDTGLVLSMTMSVMQLLSEMLSFLLGNGQGFQQDPAALGNNILQLPGGTAGNAGNAGNAGGAYGSAGSGGIAGNTSTAGGTIPVLQNQTSGNLSREQLVPLVSAERNTQEAAQLLDSLWAIYNEPGGEGRKLIEGALQNGTTIQVGNPGEGANGISVTRQEGNQYHTDITVNRGDNIKTIVHELGHALTPQDGDSIQEEIHNNILGYEILNRITGEAVPSPQEVARTTRPLYAAEGLPEDNGFVRNLFQSYGVTA